MYCTVGEVLEMIKDDMKNVIIGDEYIEDEQEREAKIATLCESAISDACAEIDGYLAKRYRVPFTKTPQVINKFAKDISVWGKEGGTTIHQISFTVDISKIKDLPLLYKLIDELKDAQNRTDSPTPATT